MDELTKSYIEAWDSILALPESDEWYESKDMLLGSLAASVSDWQNELWFVAQQLLEDYKNNVR